METIDRGAEVPIANRPAWIERHDDARQHVVLAIDPTFAIGPVFQRALQPRHGSVVVEAALYPPEKHPGLDGLDTGLPMVGQRNGERWPGRVGPILELEPADRFRRQDGLLGAETAAVQPKREVVHRPAILRIVRKQTPQHLDHRQGTPQMPGQSHEAAVGDLGHDDVLVAQLRQRVATVKQHRDHDSQGIEILARRPVAAPARHRQGAIYRLVQHRLGISRLRAHTFAQHQGRLGAIAEEDIVRANRAVRQIKPLQLPQRRK
jgi:hypothetical protein